MRKISGVLLLFSVFVLLILFPITSFSQRRSASNQIGVVDFRALLILHPSMARYDANKQAFKVVSTKASASQLDTRRKEQQQKISNLSAQARRLQAKIVEEDRSFERAMTRLSDSYLEKMRQSLATAAAALEIQTYRVNKDLTETRHRAKLRMYGDQLAGVMGQQKRLEQNSYHAGYSSPEETKQYFMAILNEAKQLVQQVAAQKSIEIVLNSSFKRSFAIADLSPSRKRLPPGHSYEAILTAPYQEPDREQRQRMNDYIAGYYANLESQTRDWMRYESSILAPFTGYFVDTDIIVGGVDITSDVLATLFRRYKINDNIGNAIIRAATTR